MTATAPAVSVVVCSYNGARTIGNTLKAINLQTVRDRAELIVVDDGSTDDTADVARAHKANVIVHEVNRGLGAARNTGVLAASAPVVAFTDDDCIPTRSWLADLLAVYQSPDVVAAGGAVSPAKTTSFVQRYLAANNPLAPLEAELETSTDIGYRTWLYLRKNMVPARERGVRTVYAVPGANLSVRRDALVAAGMFDDSVRFAGEDEEACRRLRATFPDCRIVFTPSAVVEHDFDPRLRDTLRRSRAYGEGGGRNYATGAADHPTVYPLPVAVAVLCALGVLRRPWLAVALIAPAAAFPRWLIEARRRGRPGYLLYPWIQLLQEGAADVGFARGWMKARAIAEGHVHP